MELVAEGTVIFIGAGAVLGPVLLLVLGLMTYAANGHSRDIARKAAVGAASTAPPVTRFGRPAKTVAFVIAGLLCLVALSTAVSYFARFDGSWSGPMGYAIMGMYVVQFVLVLTLVTLLIAMVWDVRVGHKRAGRDTGVAYGVVAALHALQLAAFVVLIVSGGQML
jgi:uncharacterized membrane protein